MEGIVLKLIQMYFMMKAKKKINNEAAKWIMLMSEE